MSLEEIQSNIKLIKDEIGDVKTEKKNAQTKIDSLEKSLKAKDLDKETRASLQAQVAPLQATIAALNGQLVEKEKRLAGYEQDRRELTKQSLQTDKNLSPNSSKKLQETKYYKSKSDELVTQDIADLRMWTRAYFRKTYIPKGFSVTKIKFENKKGGDQSGECANIRYYIENEDEYIEILYHLKTHERGLSTSNNHAGLFDPREMFVYVFFELIGLGSPERHFYYNSAFRENLYTASKDIDKSLTSQSWRTFDFDSNDLNFVNLFKTDDNYMKCLIYIELISKILYLNDINNNLSNFGYVRPVLSYKDIRVIDFFIKNELLNVDMLSRFKEPDISLTNKDHLDEGTKYLFKIKSDDKISMAKYIFSDILNCDKDFFKRNINAAIERTNSFMDNYGEGLKGGQKEEFDQNQINYQYYIEKVNLNFKIFIDDFVNFD